jgi:hypothetical protein
VRSVRAATSRAARLLSALVSSLIVGFAVPAVAQASPPDGTSSAAADTQPAAGASDAAATKASPAPSDLSAQPQAGASSPAPQTSEAPAAPAPTPDPAPQPAQQSTPQSTNPNASTGAGGSAADNAAASGDSSAQSNDQAQSQSTPPGQSASGNAASHGNDANGTGNGANGNGNANGQSSNHSGNANASAGSTQNNPQNVNVNVRVDQPGTNGAVTQNNDSNASALGAAGSSTTQASSTGTTAAGSTTPDANAAHPGGVSASRCGPTAAASDPATAGTSPQSTGDCAAGGGGALPTAGDPGGTTIDITIPPGASGSSDVSVNAGDPNQDGANPTATVTVTSGPATTSSADSAGADATSTQVQPTNLNVSVRVGSPGYNGPVDQRNTSTATAVAGANPATGTGAGRGPSATSTSTQVAPTNVNVSVRVGSPGADGARTQVNSSAATSSLADPATVAPALGTLPDPNDANSAAEVDNESAIVQGLAQCGDLCPNRPAQAAGADATSPAPANGASSATSTQQAPSNVDVSIRVASPGEDDGATQINSAPADGAVSVSTITTPNNLVISVVVPGAPKHVKVPSGDAPWTWNWTWTTGQAPTDQSAADTSTTTWDWTWTAPLDPAPDTPSAAAQPQSGTWTWTWDWTKPDGTTTSWTYSQACSCSWTWTWTWDSPAPTTSDARTAPQTIGVAAPPSDPTVSQTNQSSATAVALTTFSGTQSVAAASDGSVGSTASADQGVISAQDATASADVTQTRPLNQSVVTAGEIDGVQQLNGVAATAIATAYDESSQSVNQSQSGTDDGASHSLAAVQRIETLQSAQADVRAAQADAGNINEVWSPFGPSTATLGKVTQRNTAETLSIADAESAVQQVIDQGQVGGGADQDASATQVALTSQEQTASSRVSQARVTNLNVVTIPLNGVSNPAVDQSNSVSTVSGSYAGSTIDQSITQSESGDGIEWHETALQEADVKQSGAASAAASQSDRTNTAGWNGVTATPVSTPPGVESGPGVSGSPVTFLAYAPTAASGATQSAAPEITLRATTSPRRSVGRHSFVFTHRRSSVSHPGVLRSTRAGPTAPLASGNGRPIVVGAKSTAPSRPGGRPSEPPLPTKHDFNLIGTLSTAPPALLSAGFAALLEPIKLAAPGVGRLQHDAPALGRPADAALRERPG